MAINLVEAVQQKLNVDELQKIDPNTNKTIQTDKITDGSKFYQVAIPAVLTGLYKFTRIDENNQAIINNDKNEDLLASFFGENTTEIINKISDITTSGPGDIRSELNKIAETSIAVVKENLGENFHDVDVKNFLTAQRHNILLYLNPDLNLGSTISDNTVDDSTNKMEGPVSDFMHSIGQIFSSSGNDQKEEI